MKLVRLCTSFLTTRNLYTITRDLEYGLLRVVVGSIIFATKSSPLSYPNYHMSVNIFCQHSASLQHEVILKFFVSFNITIFSHISRAPYLSMQFLLPFSNQ